LFAVKFLSAVILVVQHAETADVQLVDVQLVDVQKLLSHRQLLAAQTAKANSYSND